MTAPAPVRPRNPKRPGQRVDASMGLLTDVINNALDPGYAEAAARTRTPQTPVGTAVRTAVHVVLAIVLGLVTVVAVTQLRSPTLSGPDPRDLLEREIEQRTQQAEELADLVEGTSAEIAQIQAAAVESVDPELFQRLEAYELASGAVAVTGKGLVLVVDDANVDPDDEAARIQDVDLQIVTNGLWAAGAEAIAINGKRLTALSAIRSAGQAIQVDLEPLIAPYRIEVVGDPQAMQTAFARSSAANHLAFLSGTYGITVSTSASESLVLPGVGNRTLRHAVPIDVASSSAEVEEKTSP